MTYFSLSLSILISFNESNLFYVLIAVDACSKMCERRGSRMISRCYASSSAKDLWLAPHRKTTTIPTASPMPV